MILMAVTSLQVQAVEIPLINNPFGRSCESLNGYWKCIVDVQEEGFYDYRMKESRSGFFRNQKPTRPEDLVEYDFDRSDSLKVPGDWNTQRERLFFYEGCVWYKRNFRHEPHAGKHTVLYFGAVNYEAVVYVNGKKVGTHEGGFTPFNYDITDVVVPGDNFLIVKVDNKRRANAVPTNIFDWWNYGGITRDVVLLEVDEVYVEDYSISLFEKDSKKISMSVRLNRPQPGKQVEVSISELKIKKKLITDAEGCASLVVKAKPQLWSPESPKLYKMDIVCGNDRISDEIGFRTIETSGKQILLNGKPIFLKGISIHEEKTNGGGRANGTEDAHLLLGYAKELGCNFVRLAHYPHNEWAVREAERMGVLVWSEIPCYWTIAWTDPKTYDNAARQLTDMIRRDHNRANVIIWSIANETPHSAERDLFLSRLAKHARSLDSTRLISMAMEVTSASNNVNTLKDNMNQYVDVISFNEYIGWYRDVNDAAKMSWVIPYDKPVLISEFGGGALKGYHGAKNQRWTEEFQENLYRENTRMLDKIDGLAGTTPWILKDFRSPRRVLPGVQDYYNRKGIFSDKGEKKLAFEVLKSWYEKK